MIMSFSDHTTKSQYRPLHVPGPGSNMHGSGVYNQQVLEGTSSVPSKNVLSLQE